MSRKLKLILGTKRKHILARESCELCTKRSTNSFRALAAHTLAKTQTHTHTYTHGRTRACDYSISSCRMRRTQCPASIQRIRRANERSEANETYQIFRKHIIHRIPFEFIYSIIIFSMEPAFNIHTLVFVLKIEEKKKHLRL